MGHTIICIGRQFGSGGHEIAVRLGAELGLKVYEKKLVHLACKFGELAVETLEQSDEKATNPYLYQTVHEGNFNVVRGMPTSEVLFQLQSHEIRRIAAEEDCIFVGRCADHVLSGSDARLIRVFVSAPFDARVQRKVTQEQHTSKERTKRLVRRMDKQRKQYYDHYTGLSWGDASHYDLCIDTQETSIPAAVTEIAARYRAAQALEG